jgi:hypothetical protein
MSLSGFLKRVSFGRSGLRFSFSTTLKDFKHLPPEAAS